MVTVLVDIYCVQVKIKGIMLIWFLKVSSHCKFALFQFTLFSTSSPHQLLQVLPTVYQFTQRRFPLTSIRKYVLLLMQVAWSIFYCMGWNFRGRGELAIGQTPDTVCTHKHTCFICWNLCLSPNVTCSVIHPDNFYLHHIHCKCLQALKLNTVRCLGDLP